MGLAEHVATWSKDRSRKVGCVIVGPDNEVRSLGYNGFPRCIADDIEKRHQRPTKYFFTEHSERNAIFNAARVGIPVKGCRMYLHWYPCADCARSMIQSGINEMICVEPNWDDERWGNDFINVRNMLAECGMKVRYFPPSILKGERL